MPLNVGLSDVVSSSDGGDVFWQEHPGGDCALSESHQGVHDINVIFYWRCEP